MTDDEKKVVAWLRESVHAVSKNDDGKIVDELVDLSQFTDEEVLHSWGMGMTWDEIERYEAVCDKIRGVNDGTLKPKELMRGPVLVTTCNGISDEDKQRILEDRYETNNQE